MEGSYWQLVLVPVLVLMLVLGRVAPCQFAIELLKSLRRQRNGTLHFVSISTAHKTTNTVECIVQSIHRIHDSTTFVPVAIMILTINVAIIMDVTRYNLTESI